MLAAFDLKGWIEDHRHLLKPPVGNAQIWEDSEFIVMIVGGPNARGDWHDDPADEFFYQLEGDMILRIMENGAPRDVPIKAGQVLMLPARTRHSPQRPQPGSVGLVVERKRKPGEIDGFDWYCEKCNHLLHRIEVQLASIVDDLPVAFAKYYADESLRRCTACGHLNPDDPKKKLK